MNQSKVSQESIDNFAKFQKEISEPLMRQGKQLKKKYMHKEDKFIGTPNDISVEESGLQKIVDLNMAEEATKLPNEDSLAKIIEMYENYESLTGEEKELADKQIERDKKLFVLNQYVLQLQKNTRLSARNIRRATDKKAKELGLNKIQ